MKKIQEMSSTISVLNEINQHCKSGINFYGKFTVYITNLQANVNDFITARNLEKDDWVQFLDQSQKPKPAPV
jgi:hypothetical protein